ncbi:MAG: hypothetical protein ACYCT7_02505 [bacterium]
MNFIFSGIFFIDGCNLRCTHCCQNNYSFKESDLNKLNLIFYTLNDALAKGGEKT